MAVARRPSLDEYRQALDYFRTGVPIEVIGERLGLDSLTLEQLEHEGWPEDGREPELRALRAEVLVRLTRIRAGELDVLASVAESGAKTAAQRAKTSIVAAMIENAIVSTWGRQVTDAMKGKGVTVDVLCVPKAVLENLRALRALQDPEVDRGYVDIFVKMGGRRTGDEGDGDSYEDAIVRDLMGLTAEEMEEYVHTKKIPKRQQELPFTRETETAA